MTHTTLLLETLTTAPDEKKALFTGWVMFDKDYSTQLF